MANKALIVNYIGYIISSISYLFKLACFFTAGLCGAIVTF